MVDLCQEGRGPATVGALPFGMLRGQLGIGRSGAHFDRQDIVVCARTEAVDQDMIARLEVQGLRHAAAEHGIDWYNSKHGVVAFCWHWSPPIGERSAYAKDTSFDLQRAVTDGTEEHTAALRDLDAIAGELALLRDAHVPAATVRVRVKAQDAITHCDLSAP